MFKWDAMDAEPKNREPAWLNFYRQAQAHGLFNCEPIAFEPLNAIQEIAHWSKPRPHAAGSSRD